MYWSVPTQCWLLGIQERLYNMVRTRIQYSYSTLIFSDLLSWHNPLGPGVHTLITCLFLYQYSYSGLVPHELLDWF